MYIKHFPSDSPEYARLKMAADIMTKRSPKGYSYTVEDCYFDYGQNWVWTTIICSGGYQALNPRDHEDIITGDMTRAIDRVFNSEYCPDRAA